MKMNLSLFRNSAFNKRLFSGLVLALCASIPARADIYEWAYNNPKDPAQGKCASDKVTPGGAGLDAGQYFYAGKVNLTKGYFEEADLTSAYFSGTTLVQADFAGAILSSAGFYDTDVSKATFAGADITGASFGGAKGFTKEQLYSTMSYANGDLSGINLYQSNLNGGDFTGKNLASAYLGSTNVSNETFANADLTSASFSSANVSKAVFTNADIAGANFSWAKGFTKAQMESTVSWKNKNLTGVSLGHANLKGWDFTDQIISGVNFGAATGFTKEQLYSTASWKNKDLTGISLEEANLKGWDFTGQNITGANLSQVKGLTKEQFYSTSSYQSGNLARTQLYSNDLTGWNFAGKDLTSSDFFRSKLLNANFAGANLTSASFWIAPVTNTDFTGANLKQAGFQNSKLGNTTFTDANLAEAGFYNAKLDKVNFTNANLIECGFGKAKLGKVTLDYADSRSATDVVMKGKSGTSVPMVFKSTGRNFIKPDGKVDGFDLASGQTMRIWDYNSKWGATPLNIVINKHFTMTEGSKLRMVFEDTEWGSLIEMGTSNVPVAVSLGGTLELDLADGVTPSAIGGAGTTIHLFDWTNASSVTGEFSAINWTGDYQGFTWDTSSLYTDGTITLVEPAVQGVSVRQSESLPLLQDPGTFTAVPEPGTLMLAGLAGGVLALGWVRGRSRRIS